MKIEMIAERISKDLETLKDFTSTPGNGCTRLPFTKEARGAADYLINSMTEAGLEVHEDAVGNIIGVLYGQDPQAPAVVMGSHYDTVLNGGCFDGIAGVVSAIEIARQLKANSVPLKRNFVVVAFCDEEGLRFGTGYFGSKAVLGQLTMSDLTDFRDRDGVSVYDAMKQYNLVPEKLSEAKWDLSKIKSFIELHIEQGPVLDARKVEIGLVQCIVGIQRYMITVHGRADHAGTTPMDMRIDAVEIATKVISKIPDMAREKGEGNVATTGYIKVLPGGMNVVAGSVEFSVDIRSKKTDNIDDIVAKIKAELEEHCGAHGASYEIATKLVITPVHLCEPMLDVLEKSCQQREYSYQRIISGAGHDALAIGQLLDTVMVFVPSKDGRSHCPVEWTDYADFAKAITVIYDLVLDQQ